MQKNKLSVLIPAYNESEKIEETLKALKNNKNIFQIIVIDDGSTDDTFVKAGRYATERIKLKENQGKGNALNIAAKYIKGEFVGVLDGDLGKSAEEIEKIFEPVVKGQVDIAVAIFPPPLRKGGFGIVKKTAFLALKIKTKKSFEAPLSGQRVMTKQAFQDILPFSTGFGVEIGMTIEACRKGMNILEVKTNMSHNETGRNVKDFLHRAKQFRDIFRTLIIKGCHR